METLDILKSSKELVDKIYENMNKVETCSTIAEAVKEIDVCFHDGENHLIELNGVMTSEQMLSIREQILQTINDNSNEASRFLERLNNLSKKKSIINKDFDDAVNEMIDSCNDVVINKPTNWTPAPEEDHDPVNVYPDMTVEEVTNLYLKKNKSAKELIKYYGVSKSMFERFLAANDIKKNCCKDKQKQPEKRKSTQWKEHEIPDTVETENRIKALYTNKKSDPFTMKMLAEEFHCEQTTIHDFIVEHNLLRKYDK